MHYSGGYEALMMLLLCRALNLSLRKASDGLMKDTVMRCCDAYGVGGGGSMSYEYINCDEFAWSSY